MANGKRSKRRSGPKAPKPPNSPQLKVRVVAAAGELSTAMNLVKPALLYADRVTILSPAAWMLRDLTSLAQTEDPLDQIQMLFSLLDAAPNLAGDLQIPDELRVALPVLVRQPQLVRLIAADAGEDVDEALDGIRAAVEEITEKWHAFTPALEQARETLGGTELAEAVERKLVSVEDLGTETSPELLATVVGTASADPGGVRSGSFDALAADFLVKALDVMSDRKSLPLFDADASGLVRAFDSQAGRQRAGGDRAREIGAVASLAGFLPYFTQMPVNEIVDLRRELSVPLIRFRAAMARMSRDVATHPLDTEFQADIESRWRSDIEPALLEIRETLAEHGLLRQVSSVATGDPRRLMVESGAVIAAAMSPQNVLDGAVAAVAAGAVPALDTVLRAYRESKRGRSTARASEFYLLHRVDEASRVSARP